MGWSCLSGLSLAEVSHIAVINLLFCPHDLWNGHRYSKTSINSDSLTISTHGSSLRSKETQAAPILRQPPNARAPINPGKMGKALGPIKEDTAVPIATRAILLLGK